MNNISVRPLSGTVSLSLGDDYIRLDRTSVIRAFMALAEAECKFKAEKAAREDPTHDNIVSWAIGIVQNEGSDELAKG